MPKARARYAVRIRFMLSSHRAGNWTRPVILSLASCSKPLLVLCGFNRFLRGRPIANGNGYTATANAGENDRHDHKGDNRRAPFLGPAKVVPHDAVGVVVAFHLLSLQRPAVPFFSLSAAGRSHIT